MKRLLANNGEILIKGIVSLLHVESPFFPSIHLKTYLLSIFLYLVYMFRRLYLGGRVLELLVLLFPGIFHLCFLPGRFVIIRFRSYFRYSYTKNSIIGYAVEYSYLSICLYCFRFSFLSGFIHFATTYILHILTYFFL